MGSYSPVTAASFSGAPYSGKARNSSPVRNNGGTVMYGGNIASVTTPGAVVGMTQSLGNVYFGFRSGVNGSVVPFAPQSAGVAKALANGTFATMTPGVYIGMRYSNASIAGVASTLLAGGAGYASRKSENSYIGSVRTTAYIMTGGWYWSTGQPVNRSDRTDVIPNEVLPTFAIPGKLTYMITGKTAFVDQYKPKTD